MVLRPVNFINPASCVEGYDMLTMCWSAGFDYEQTHRAMCSIGFYVPEDQFRAFIEVLNIQSTLDTGDRQHEYGG